MTPQELKNSILQHAIQGKLVEQRKEEGTGEELYQQIQKEKAKLIKAGKIKKEKPLPEITEDEIPFDIPESWKWVHIGELFQHNTGKALNSSDKSGEPYEYITTSNVYWNRFELNNLKTMLFTKSETEKCSVKKGDLLVLEGGDIGRAAIWNYDFPMRIQNHIHRLRPFGEVSIEFFYHLFFLYKNAGLINGKGIGIKGLSAKVLHMLIVPLPPLAEQKRIVAKIEEFLPYIDRYEEAWSKLEEFNTRFPTDMQKSLLQHAIQGKLVEQREEEGTGEELYQKIQKEKAKLIKAGKIKKGKPLPEITEDEIPFDIPESWKWARVAEVTTLNPKNVLDDDLETGFIPMPYVCDGFQNQHSYDSRKWRTIKKGFTHFANGDIGVAKITPCFQNRKSVIFKDLPNGYGAGTTELSIVRTISDTMSNEYLLWFFKTHHFIINGVKTFSGTAGQQRIHKDYLSHSLIPLPPLAEQKRIVAKLEEMLPLCEKLK
jgi:type I restriction enzyme S subunit